MGNHIDHIEITNFKSIRHAKIEGCKRINVFIGYPNVGKSNILEALSLFSLPYLKIAGSKKLTDFVRTRNLPGLFYGTDTDTPISINLNNNMVFKASFDKAAYYPLECEYENVHRSQPISLAQEEGTKILFDNDLNAKFLNLPNKVGGLGDFKVLKYHFSVEKFKPKKTVFPALIPPFGNNLFEVINNETELSDLLRKEFAKVGGEYIYDTEENTGKMLSGKENKRFTLPFSSIADTLQRLIFYSAAVASNEKAVLLFEEPEAHMFPPYIRKFNGDVIYDKNDNQYFIITHSPFVFDDFIEEIRDELSVYLVDYKNEETVIKRLSGDELDNIYKYHVDLFFNTESYLD